MEAANIIDKKTNYGNKCELKTHEPWNPELAVWSSWLFFKPYSHFSLCLLQVYSWPFYQVFCLI